VAAIDHRPPTNDYVMRLILASASPRRADLLTEAGFDFEIAPVYFDETPRPGDSAEAHVKRLAEEKAAAALRQHPDAVVVGADTVVVVDHRMLGKPASRQEAERMIRSLAGRTHEVLTGVCVSRGGHTASHVERTTVRIARLDDEEIVWYVASGEPADKAGAYAIQGLGARFVREIHGSYTGVVGLPLYQTLELLGRFGIAPRPSPLPASGERENP
jgi:septum formation protein